MNILLIAMKLTFADSSPTTAVEYFGGTGLRAGASVGYDKNENAVGSLSGGVGFGIEILDEVEHGLDLNVKSLLEGSILLGRKDDVEFTLSTADLRVILKDVDGAPKWIKSWLTGVEAGITNENTLTNNNVDTGDITLIFSRDGLIKAGALVEIAGDSNEQRRYGVRAKVFLLLVSTSFQYLRNKNGDENINVNLEVPLGLFNNSLDLESGIVSQIQIGVQYGQVNDGTANERNHVITVGLRGELPWF